MEPFASHKSSSNLMVGVVLLLLSTAIITGYLGFFVGSKNAPKPTTQSPTTQMVKQEAAKAGVASLT